MKLRVFYGYSKLTKVVMRKPELSIWFENSHSFKNDKWIEQRVHLGYTRYQTEEEMKVAENSTRMFTKYGYFINNKPFNGDIQKVLDANSYDDRGIISEKERKIIRDKLLEAYNKYYKYQTVQLQLV